MKSHQLTYSFQQTAQYQRSGRPERFPGRIISSFPQHFIALLLADGQCSTDNTLQIIWRQLVFKTKKPGPFEFYTQNLGGLYGDFCDFYFCEKLTMTFLFLLTSL